MSPVKGLILTLFFSVSVALTAFCQEQQPVKTERDTVFQRVELDTLEVGESKSGYDDIEIETGANSTQADLRNDDIKKDSWLYNYNVAEKIFDPYYDFKRWLKVKTNIAVGMDYIFLNQISTFSFSDRQASSGVYRFFGDWRAPLKNSKGALIFKIENRHNIGGGVTPRNLGYEAGAAMSTATFKDFSWGLTNFFWKHRFKDDKYMAALGVMDAGDWTDLYPLLNAFKFFLNEAFFNSPTMALPNQGFGAVFGVSNIIPDFYVIGGIQDANGDPTMWLVDNVSSFFSTNEFFVWGEIGWSQGFKRKLAEGHTVHILVWHQDARVKDRELADQVERSWGINFSAARDFGERWTTFFRAGYSEGNGAIMRSLLKFGGGYKIVKHDLLGVGIHWGAPSDRNFDSQTGLEVFYALQLTDHLNITPDVQLTFDPSFNDEKSTVGIWSVVRIRYAM